MNLWVVEPESVLPYNVAMHIFFKEFSNYKGGLRCGRSKLRGEGVKPIDTFGTNYMTRSHFKQMLVHFSFSL